MTLFDRDPARHLPSMNRRTVLKGTAALALSCVGVPGRAASSPPALGIQLYTMRVPLAQDLEGTLAALRKMGYAQVETLGMLNHDAKSFRAALDAAGLRAPSAHIFPKVAQPLLFKMASGQMSVDEAWDQIDASMGLDRMEGMLADMFEQSQLMGYQYLVYASMDSKLLESMEGIRHICAVFRRAGDLCHEHGLNFTWHPHVQEWGMVEGKPAVERILDGTDPHRVSLELDFFWAAMAKVDLPQFLRRYSGRIPLGHFKDIAKGIVVPDLGFKNTSEIKNEYFEDAGFGQLDFRVWIPLARKAGMRHFFVERDYSPDPLASAGRSYGSLRKMMADSEI